MGRMTARQITEVRQQLKDYVEEFGAKLGRSERRRWCGKYLEGLLREGERQALQQFVIKALGITKR